MGIVPILPIVVAANRRRDQQEPSWASHRPRTERMRHPEPFPLAEIVAACIGLLLGITAIIGIQALVEHQSATAQHSGSIR